MTTSTPQAVPGRRVTYRHPILSEDLPGSIVTVDEGTLLRVRLDGHRRTITVQSRSEAVTYLPEVTAIPPIPVGRFRPIPEELTAIRQGVMLALLGADALVMLTADRDAAIAAGSDFLAENGVDPATVDWTTLEARWAGFDWPEDTASFDWTLSWVAEGDDQAIHAHYLPSISGAPTEEGGE